MAANYVLLETIELTQSAASVTFDNIPQTGYTDLKVVASMREAGNDIVRFSLGFNSTTKTTTVRKILYGSGLSAASTTGSANTSVGYGSVRSSATANTFGNVEVYIPNYTSSNYKSFSVDAVEENNSVDSLASISAGLWENTSAITSLSVLCDSPTFVANSTFSLYGVADVNTTPVVAPKASGGNIVGNDGTYWYHAFKSSGTFTPQNGLSCDVLVVAGGGSGGGTTCCGVWPGGGGAGGVFYTTTGISTAQTVTIGAGGAAPTAGGHPNGNQGSNSVFGSLTAAVGGGYGSGVQQAGGAGGSGGGAGDYTNNQIGGAATSGQGFAGGNGGGGGGGGAGAAGTAGTRTTNGVSGGIGTNAYSSWLTPTGLGVSGYIAGGGGGSASSGGTAGSGGSGGGGNSGTYQANGNAAVANTGGGGGAAGQSQGPDTIGGAGGSGIVIIRYAMA
jgi:hypothetical protein